MAHLSLLMLGTFQAALDGHPIASFESCKARALLAYLVNEMDCPHTRSHLASLFWPRLAEPAALGNLRHALANLRCVLGDHHNAVPFIVLSDNSLQFNRSCNHHTDIAAFYRLATENSHNSPNIQQLENAIDLYRGDFLEGLELAQCSEFEEWILVKRVQSRWLLITVLDRLCDQCESTGEYEKAVRYARQMVQQDPWDEAAHQHLMHALALGGHRGDALHQYIDCRRILQAEFQVAPSPAITALYEHIRNGTFPDLESDARPKLGEKDHIWRQTKTSVSP